jgi:hypothetical protein
MHLCNKAGREESYLLTILPTFQNDVAADGQELGERSDDSKVIATTTKLYISISLLVTVQLASANKNDAKGQREQSTQIFNIHYM